MIGSSFVFSVARDQVGVMRRSDEMRGLLAVAVAVAVVGVGTVMRRGMSVGVVRDIVTLVCWESRLERCWVVAQER